MRIEWTAQKIPSRRARVISGVGYSAAVFFGEAGKPARPWMWVAASEIDFGLELTQNFKRLGNIDAAFDAVALNLFSGIRDALKKEIYEWPRVTLRSSGAIVGSPRDIFDTGELWRGHRLEL